MKTENTLILMTILCILSACATPSEPPSTATTAPSQTPTDDPGIAPLLTITEAKSLSFKAPYGVAINEAGEVYITDSGNSRVLRFDSNGNLISTWDKKGTGDGEFNSLGFGGLAIDQQGNVFVVDNGNHRIQKFDSDGVFILAWGTEGTGDGQFVRAIGIATDVDGNVYVTDDGNPFIQKFDDNGNFIMKWGGPGSEDGQFEHATGITVDGNGNIFVADYENKKIQKFDAGGQFITSWIISSANGVKGTPEGLAADSQGQIYVSDYDLGQIQAFNNDGELLWLWNDSMRSTGHFSHPTSIALDATGKIYIVNQSGKSLEVFQLP